MNRCMVCLTSPGDDARISTPGLTVLRSDVFALSLALLKGGLDLRCLLLQLLLMLLRLCHLSLCNCIVDIGKAYIGSQIAIDSVKCASAA